MRQPRDEKNGIELGVRYELVKCLKQWKKIVRPLKLLLDVTDRRKFNPPAADFPFREKRGALLMSGLLHFGLEKRCFRSNGVQRVTLNDLMAGRATFELARPFATVSRFLGRKTGFIGKKGPRKNMNSRSRAGFWTGSQFGSPRLRFRMRHHLRIRTNSEG
jgi:hypothetical protein